MSRHIEEPTGPGFESGSPLDERSELKSWEERAYGRNVLYIWQKE